eukprot:76962-Prorocentrum_minimum.AAC.1
MSKLSHTASAVTAAPAPPPPAAPECVSAAVLERTRNAHTREVFCLGHGALYASLQGSIG